MGVLRGSIPSDKVCVLISNICCLARIYYCLSRQNTMSTLNYITLENGLYEAVKYNKCTRLDEIYIHNQPLFSIAQIYYDL